MQRLMRNEEENFVTFSLHRKLGEKEREEESPSPSSERSHVATAPILLTCVHNVSIIFSSSRVLKKL